jgi:excisionase family DNA binding protein
MLGSKPRRSSAETVTEWNVATGAHLDETLIVDALENLRVQGWLTEAPPGLTAAEIDYLEQHGGVADDRDALVKSRVGAAVLEDTLQQETMTVEQAAELMQVSASRVRHRIKEGSVYAYPSGGRGVGRKIPRWQFHGPGPVPHLAAVLDALPERFRPSDIRAFALNAVVDDPDNGVSVPLLHWLRDGGDPEIARALAESEARLI